MKPLTPKQLSGAFGRKLETVAKGIGQSISWLESARETAPRLNLEADRLSVRLRRQQNKAANLAEAAGKESALGFFGLSQAGKSYLISALAASEKGRMEIALGNATFDYRQLNPQQQTGTMVMRFSGQQIRVDNEWPVQLALLSEEEVIAVLVELWAKREVDPSAIPDEQHIAERLKTLAMYRQPQEIQGLNSSNVVALWDRVSTTRQIGSKALESHFWPVAVALAPVLSVDDRARLFSIQWGEDR